MRHALTLPGLLACCLMGSSCASEPEATARGFQVEAAQRQPARTDAPAALGKEAVVLLYKAADTASAQRTDEGVDTATRLLENTLVGIGYKVMQPDVATQSILDKGPRTIVTFAADAGLSVMLSAKRRELSIPGDPTRVQAEFALNAKVYCGSVLQPSPPEVSGKVTALRTSLGKGYDVAARRAATQLADTLRTDLGKRGKACEGALERMIRDYRSSEPEVSTPTPLPSGPLPPPDKIWAILVGVSDFKAARQKTGWEISDLRGVRADMDLMQRTLLERGLPRSQIITLLNEKATASNFRQQLRTLQTQAARDDLILVYISSHGLGSDLREGTPDKPSLSGYGLPVFHDFNPNDANTIVDFWEIQSLLLNTRAQQVVWMVDTCHAGGASLGLQSSGTPVQASRAGPLDVERVQLSARGLQWMDPANAVFDPEQVAQAANQVASGRNLVVISAATPEQLALEDGNGLFTASVVQGLKRNRNPIAVEQLFNDHVVNQVQEAARRKGHTQNPVMGKSGRGGDIKL